jgi:small conductance mechanosensitive channel
MKPIWQRLNVELLVTQFVAWLPSLLAAVLIVAAFWVLYRLTRSALQGILHSAGFDHALLSMLLNVYRFAVMTFGVVMAAGQLGINVGAALAGLGVVGLTIGFAAKDTLSNIMAGFLIFWDKPFHVGDWISIGDKEGKVAEITMRTTRVMTRRNTWVIIPNETVINQVMVNHSTNGKVRVDVPVGIGYKDDIAKAREVLIEAVSVLEGISKEDPVRVIVHELGASSVDLLVLAWVPDAEHEKPMYFRIMETIKYTLDAAGIDMPYPHAELHINSVNDGVWSGVQHTLQTASAVH